MTRSKIHFIKGITVIMENFIKSMSLLLLPLAIISCSFAPVAQPTPPPPAMETDTPAPTFTPLPSPTITPTKNPIDFDLTGDWFFLTANESKSTKGTLIQKGDVITGSLNTIGNDKVIIEGRINPVTLDITGTWSSSEGRKGTFTLRLHGSANELVGMNNLNQAICIAREQSALPKRCDWK